MITRPIKMGSNKKAFLVIKGDRPIGTITQSAEQANWVVYVGVGDASRHLANVHSKRLALKMLNTHKS